MAIFFIRHGETAGNAAGIIQMPETPLNLRGLAQAERLGRRLADRGVAQIVTSDYARAYMTAECLQRATAAPLSVLETLRERHFGDVRGRTHAEIGDIYAPDFAPPGGETWEQFHARVDRCWRELRGIWSATAGNLAVVTHGLVCYSLALRHWRLPAGRTADRGFGNTSVSVVDDRPPFSVRLLNDCAHLDDTTEHPTGGAV